MFPDRGPLYVDGGETPILHSEIINAWEKLNKHIRVVLRCCIYVGSIKSLELF